MSATAYPSTDFDQRRALPPGGDAAPLVMDDGFRLRARCWEQGEARRASILLAGGRADFIEKFAESIWHWRAHGHALLAFDWRGQGGSGRLGDHPHKGHAGGFEQWIDDLAAIVAIAQQRLPAPLCIVAHSMGAHLALRLLSERPTPVAGAVLISPMLGIGAPGDRWKLRWSARAACALGRARDWAAGQGPYSAHQRREARQLLLTHSRERFDDEGWWLEQQPELALGGVSWGWLDAAWRSIARLETSGAIEAIDLPCLVLLGREERLVDVTAAARAAARLPHGRVQWIDGGRHELLREADAQRQASWAAIDTFMQSLPAP